MKKIMTNYRNDVGDTSGAAAVSANPTASAQTDKTTTPTSTNSVASSTGVTAVAEEYGMSKWGAIAGLAGLAGGLYFAHKRGAKWYGYIGWAFLFGLIGGVVGEMGERTIKAIKD